MDAAKALVKKVSRVDWRAGRVHAADARDAPRRRGTYGKSGILEVKRMWFDSMSEQWKKLCGIWKKWSNREGDRSCDIHTNKPRLPERKLQLRRTKSH